MHSFTRHALRLSLAGAGALALGAGIVGPASADEEPTGNPDAEALPDTSQVADNYVPEGTDSADFTDASESASPFGTYPGGGTLLPLQTIPTPQDALDTENITNFLAPDGADIAKVIAFPLGAPDEG